MKSSTKYILGGVGVFVVIIIGIVAYGAYTIYSTLTSFGVGREIPAELKEARITVGSEFLRRSEFFRLEKSGWLDAINEGSKVADEKQRQRIVQAKLAAGIYNFSDLQVIGEEVIAVAEFGGFVFDLQGNLKNQIAFQPATERVKVGPFEGESQQTNFDNLRIVRLDSQRIGYLSFGMRPGMTVYDSRGDELWTTGRETLDLGAAIVDSEKEYEESRHVLEAAVGDLDGDGVSEYIVARKNDGIRVYDQSGKEKWFSPDDFPSGNLQVLDVDGDGRAELLVTGDSIRDGDGKVIRELKTAGDAMVFSPRNDKGFDIAWADTFQGKLTYTSETGQKLFSADAPLSEIKKPAKHVEVPGTDISYTDDRDTVAYPRAALITLREGEPKYLAVIASFIGFPRANFYVYDQNGKLVYHELLPEDAETIAALPSESGVDSILIGGKDTIWKYSVK